jgi:polyphenol oxidase
MVPVPLVPATSQPIRVRKSVFELSAEEIARLKSAYAALRRLYRDRPDDPRNWYHQGVVHCWYCSGALDAIWGPEIHGGWFFLPWHRAYLHFHEQILGALVNDPSFTIPYWDWDSPGRNRFPPPYMEPADQTNPLFDPFRAVTPDSRIPENLTGPETMKRVLEQSTFALFAGVGEGASGTSGAIERAPHGGVHLWVTNPTTLLPPQINMGVLGTAALDPVFFAHHANIDRLWQVWLDATTTPPHANPADDVWLQQAFVFYNEQRQWTQIQVDQVLDSQATLRYRYQAPAPAGAPPPVVPLAPRVARLAAAQPPSSPALEIAAPPGGAALTPDPHTLRVSVPAPAASRLTSATAGPGQVTLRIEGVEVPPDRGALVNVFLNRPDATAATPTTDPGFVGSIVLVPNMAGGAHAHRPVVRNFAFDVTRQLRSAPPAPGADIVVTLVPFLGDGKRPSDIALRYRRVYLATE